jgi:hypothetical protein
MRQPGFDRAVALWRALGGKAALSRLPPNVSHAADNAGKKPPVHPPYAGYAGSCHGPARRAEKRLYRAFRRMFVIRRITPARSHRLIRPTRVIRALVIAQRVGWKSGCIAPSAGCSSCGRKRRQEAAGSSALRAIPRPPVVVACTAPISRRAAWSAACVSVRLPPVP